MTRRYVDEADYDATHGLDIPPPGLLGEPRANSVGANGERSLLAKLRNGAWLDAQEFPPLRYAVRPIIPEGQSMLIGGPKIGKTNMMQGIALAVASGGIALGAIELDKPRPVLGLFLEDGDRRLQDKFRKLLEGVSPIPERLDYLTRLERPGTVLETIGEWLVVYGDEEPLVILDTLGKVMPPAFMGESAYQRDYRIGSALKRLADDHPGMSLVICHHDRKAESADFVDNVSGTNGLAGAADTVIVLSRDRHEAEGMIQVTGRDIPEGEYALRIVDGISWQLVGGTLEAAAGRATDLRTSSGLGDRSLELLAYVREHPKGVTAKDVDDALDLSDARTYLGRLADKGRIRRLRRGVYAPARPPIASVASVANEGADVLPLPQSNSCNTPPGGHE